MLRLLKRPALAAAFVALTPLAALLPGGASEAEAHGRGYGYGRGKVAVAIGAPVVVVGYSYGDPFAYGHVHRSPAHCSHGPIYYYPRHGVYAHHYPRYRYYDYARPDVYRGGRHDHRLPLPPHARFIRNRLKTHAEHLRELFR